MNINPEYTHQRIEYARASLWVPFYTVGMTARIQGDVPPELVKEMLRKLQILYPPLASRVLMDEDGTAWLTTEGVEDCSLDELPWTAEDDWAKVFLEQERVPFALSKGPVARFFLLRGATCSDLIAIIPHVIGDGYSMTLVMKEAINLLNNPDKVVKRPAPPPAITWQTIPHSAIDNLPLRALVRAVNLFWPNHLTALHQEKYEELHGAYWARQQVGLLSFKLCPVDTSQLLERCRQHGISVTGALIAAFLLSGVDLQPDWRPYPWKISVAMNLRERMLQPPDGAMGMYVSVVNLALRANTGISFWELAQQAHLKIHRRMNNRPHILRPLVMDQLDPMIADSIISAISTDRWGRDSGLLGRFLKQSEDKCRLNVSNIGRISLPEADKPFTLQTLLPFPPLVPFSGPSLNVLTTNDQMNIILRYHQDEWKDSTITKVQDQVISYLREA
jgi:hypothetical protein